MSRTDQEIVDQTNTLAHRMLAEAVGTGYVHDEGESFKIYDHLDNPRYAKAWELACMAQELITATDPNDALSALPGLTVYAIDMRVTATLYVRATSEEEAALIAKGLHCDTIHVTDAGESEIEISGLRFDDPELPDVSLSPAMTVFDSLSTPRLAGE